MRFGDAMVEVLQTRRYDRLTGRTRDIWRMLMEWVERLITNLLERLNLAFPQGLGDGRAVTVIFSVVGGVLLVAGLAVLARIFWRARQRKAHDLSDIFAELAANAYTVADLLQLSDDAPERRAAVRYRYIAALVALDEAMLIRITPSATNALILRGLRKAHPHLAHDFSQMTHVYHLAWFGYREIDDGGYAQFVAACRVLTETKGGRQNPLIAGGSDHA